jgi:hypothetical protein
VRADRRRGHLLTGWLLLTGWQLLTGWRLRKSGASANLRFQHAGAAPFTSHSDNSQRQQHQQSQHVEDPLPASQSQRIHAHVSIPSMEPLRSTTPPSEGRKNVTAPKNYGEKWRCVLHALTRAPQPVAYGDETHGRHCRRRARNP